MEGSSWRDDVVVTGDSGDESVDGSSSGGVELSLRLRTGGSRPPPAAAAVEQQPQEAAARRSSMAIFYDSRVCAVDVTEIQAREIISMANWEIILADQRQQQHREDRHVQDRCSSSSRSATERCGGQAMTSASAAAAAAGCPRLQGLAATAAPVVVTTDQAGLSMKRSLQRFLQKREARRAATVAPPYTAAGGRQAHQLAMRH